MNLLDRTIAYFSPKTAVKREFDRLKLDTIQNSGYGNYGANRTKKSLKGWKDQGGSALEDIQFNLSTLRVRSRDLFMGNPVAASAIKTYRTNVVGGGLVPKPVIDGEYLHMDTQRAEKLENAISREFDLWASSQFCDAEKMSSFWDLQQLAFLSWLQSGDAFALLQEREQPNWPYSLCIRLVEADRVCTPGAYLDLELSEKVVGGVEVDDAGGVVAYHICKKHPLSTLPSGANEWVRVEAIGSVTGRRNVLHLMARERIGARRGVPILAPVIEALRQLGRYTDAELVAAVVNGYWALIIEQPEANESLPIGEQGAPDEALVDGGDKNSVELGNGSIFELGPGEKAHSESPGRPNSNFSGFVDAITKQIAAGLELPQEIVMKQFSHNYSASRAALLEAWKAFSMWRDWMIEKFCQPIYEEWMDEAVARGRIIAPGYFEDKSIRAAYTKAEWYGPTQGQLDVTKESEAAEMRVKSGFSTRTKEAMELTGTDFRDNMRTARRERELMEEAGLAEQTIGGETN
jgi:lambda family phage portal protein